MIDDAGLYAVTCVVIHMLLSLSSCGQLIREWPFNTGGEGGGSRKLRG